MTTNVSGTIMVMDVEDHSSGGGGAFSCPSTYSLSHLVVLPLPQNYTKAAE